MKKRLIPIIAFSFLFATAAIASDSLMLPVIYPSKITAYDIEQGLPASCAENVFVDKKGRLWLNPCSYEEIHKTLSFYQFDGYRSYFRQIKVPGEDNDLAKAILHGITNSVELYGRIQSLKKVFFSIQIPT